jgi:hypothetical protein
MVRRKFVSEYGFRFDEIKYSNDYYFSFCVGHYAKQIAVSDRILYVYTSRPGSLSALFCSKPNELAIRAEVAFRVEREIKRSRVGIEQQRPFRWYLGLMLKRDRKLFKTYYLKFNELYASSHEALLDICEGKNVLLRICVYLYLQWLKLTTNGK